MTYNTGYGQSYGARSPHLSWLMKLSEGVRGLQSWRSDQVINKLLEDNWKQYVYSQKVDNLQGQLGSTYGGVSEVSGGHAVLWSGI